MRWLVWAAPVSWVAPSSTSLWPHLRGESRDIVAVEPTRAPGHYRVMAHGRRIAGEADAAGALRLVLDSMAE